jgi:uncharacterized membrane protein
MLGKFTPGKSAPFFLSKEEKQKILCAGCYSMVSVLIVLPVVLLFLTTTHPVFAMALLVPVVNVIIYALKLWISDNR